MLVFGVAPPHARHAPVIPEPSPCSHRPVQIGLFSFFFFFLSAESSRFHMSELHLDVHFCLSRGREGGRDEERDSTLEDEECFWGEGSAR